MTMQEATFLLLKKLRSIYSDGETNQITDWVMEHLTGSKKAERMIYKNESITSKEEEQLQDYIKRLMAHEPVQYVLNEAWFCGLKFYVDKNVLIPRPETEELVEWVVKEARGQKSEIRILDVGAGSGCIPVSLKKKLENATVWSCDISNDALQVAKRNATTLAIDVNFIQLDFLNEEQREKLPAFDIIVSNPPYIPVKEKIEMQPNVLENEPPTALFVPDNDTLVFYRAIATFGKNHLNKNGMIYTEINESLGKTTTKLFQQNGYITEIKKDMQGKERMIKAVLETI